MKTKLGLILLSIVLFSSCKEKSNPVSNSEATLPVVLTSDISDINAFTARSGGSVTSDGGAPVLEKGICWSTTASPKITDNKSKDGSVGTGAFFSELTNLSTRTTYYVRAYATNSVGTAYGNEVSFSSGADLPKITTNTVTLIKQESAQSGGSLSSEGEAAVTVKGICWGTNPSPTILGNKTEEGAGISGFSSKMESLTSNTRYYVRAYATNTYGTGYGNEISFTTRQDTLGTVVDTVGNVYKTVKIGNQWWMAENLRTTKYRNGAAIATVTDNTAWSNLSVSKTGAYCNYDNDAANATSFGLLYNWYAVNDAKNIAPKGWHVATDADWTALETYLGTNPGTKLKSKTGWNSGNGTDFYGFAALPGGDRGFGGAFENKGNMSFWWTANELASSNNAWFRGVYGGTSTGIDKNNNSKTNGYYIRCVKD